MKKVGEIIKSRNEFLTEEEILFKRQYLKKYSKSTAHKKAVQRYYTKNKPDTTKDHIKKGGSIEDSIIIDSVKDIVKIRISQIIEEMNKDGVPFTSDNVLQYI